MKKMLPHGDSPYGVNGINTYATVAPLAAGRGGDGGGGNGYGDAGEIMLFGVRVTVDSMRKSVSLNNLSQYEQPHQESSYPAATAGFPGAAAGYASADDAVPQSATTTRERKRGVPWTEDEHKLFLLGLQKVGKGDWRGISRNFVKTRTPTQVASHAQKYFLRRSNLNRRRRRSSLFDITADAIVSMEEEQVQAEKKTPQPSLPLPKTYNAGIFSAVSVFPVPVQAQIENTAQNLTLGKGHPMSDLSSSSSSSSSSFNRLRSIPILAVPSMDLDLHLNQQKPTADADPLPLSLNFSPPSDQSRSTRHSAFQPLPSFNNGDSIISVA